MIKYYTYVEPLTDSNMPMYVTMSDYEILRAYKPYFIDRIIKVGKNPEDFDNNEIMKNWIIVNWAWETDKYGNKIEK